MSRVGSLDASGDVIGPALHVHRALSRHGLENDLRGWYLRSCRDHMDSAEQGYFKRRRDARHWFKELCKNHHFQHAVAAFSREQEALSRTMALVGLLRDAQRTVNNRLIPKRFGRLSQLDKVNADGGLRESLFPELDRRLPSAISKRTTTIAGLSDFLGLPSTGKELTAALRRNAHASATPTKPRGALGITRLLQSWEAPDSEK